MVMTACDRVPCKRSLDTIERYFWSFLRLPLVKFSWLFLVLLMEMRSWKLMKFRIIKMQDQVISRREK